MKKDRTKLVLWLLVLSIAVFIGVQILMLFNSYELEKNKFVFLRTTLLSSAFFQLNPDLKELGSLSTTLLSDEKSLSSSEISAKLKHIIRDYGNFKSVFTQSFYENNVNVEFDYSVVLKRYSIFNSPDNKKTVFDDSGNNGQICVGNLAAPEKAYLASTYYYKGNNYFAEIYLYIRYTNAAGYIIRQMQDVVIISFIAMFIVFCVFFFTIRTLIKQKKLSEMKSDFINNITHEFNTPLNTIKVAGANLKNKQTNKSPEEVERLADIIIRQNNRLQKLIEDVMNASVLEEEKLSLNYADADICELVNTAVADIKIKYEESRIEFVIDSPAELKCLCDEFQIMTAVYNIIDNAAKYSPENSKIEVEIKQDGKFVSLSVTDHGIGISVEDRKHIFEKFFRTRSGKFTSVKGLGLGLYFVKNIIDAHSGEIEVVSLPGKGSTFIIHLPADK